MLLLIMLRMLRNNINHSKSNDSVSSLSGVEGRGYLALISTIKKHSSVEPVKAVLLSLSKHTPPLLHDVLRSGDLK